MEVLHLTLTVDEKHVAEAATALRTRLPTGQWQVLTQLAAEVVALQERETGSTVLVVPASSQAEEVARALGVPGLIRAVDRVREASR